MLQLETWQVLTLGAMLIAGYAGIAWRLLAVYTQRTDERFKVLTEGTELRFTQIARQIETLSEQEGRRGEQVLQLERELATLRLEMMRDFTRREDHNQAIASIRISLDNMSLRIEKALAQVGRIDV